MRRYAKIILLLGTAIVLSGCSSNGTKNASSEMTSAPTQATEEQTEKEETLPKEQEGSTYTWNEITVTIPKAWEGRYIVKETSQGFYFIQRSSDQKKADSGYICGFSRCDKPAYQVPGGVQIAYTKENMYLMTKATSVTYYANDQHVVNEYENMAAYLDDMAASVKINDKEAKYFANEYVCAMSEYYKLTEDDLMKLNDNDLRMAQNEIYARYGCRFEDVNVQNWFDGCSWYEPSVDLQEFDESKFNEVEAANLELFIKQEKDYIKKHPYPMQYDTKDTIKEDLDGDGTVEEIQYQATEEAQVLIINGTEYDLSSLGAYLENPVADRIYITDISSYRPGLEIAVLAEGPSDDPETYFFQYDGQLHFIGSVTGFPFREETGMNGFIRDDVIRGTVRLDIIHTCVGYGIWKYNSNSRQLEYQEGGSHEMRPGDIHELYVDIPVYQSMTQTSNKTIMKACSQVTFVASDGANWIQIKNKEGQKGYVYIEDRKIDGKDAEQVFSNLLMCD